MMPKDPLLKMSDRQYREILPLYEPADPLGWFPKLLIAGTSLIFGAGCAAVVVLGVTWRKLSADLIFIPQLKGTNHD